LTLSKSSTESEYIALSTGAQEAVWLKRLLAELDNPGEAALLLCYSRNSIQLDLKPHIKPLTILCDNQSSLKLAKTPMFHARTKHTEVAHHFVREKALSGEIKLDYISSNSQPTNILIKALPGIKFKRHRVALGLRSLLDLQ